MGNYTTEYVGYLAIDCKDNTIIYSSAMVNSVIGFMMPSDIDLWGLTLNGVTMLIF